ncbi:MAG: putative DNA binding domain-containing protein [Lachnospiraceae bacterium]|jgi:ATP-dependent DNA helicase RecG|nr:putative DNA binding domain-containing protein [Lachnospiraceae bacterium]
MQPDDLVSLVEFVKRHKYESQTLEVKAAQAGCPTRLFPTLSSFSNQDDGGTILLGMDENNGFEIVGVYDPQDLQKRVLEQCKQMEPSVRPLFTLVEIEGKVVVSIEIPSVDVIERPVYYKGVGRIKGSYIRIGESNEVMSEYEIYSYDSFRKRIQDDLRKVNNAKRSQFNSEGISKYLDSVKNERRNLSERVSDDVIMELMGITADGIPTLAGVMSFSLYPQAYFPQLSITAVSIPGMEMGETGDDNERFIDNQRLTGVISEMVDLAVDFVKRNSRTSIIIDNDGKRRDKLEYPMRAVREAILNALVHRDYSIYTQNVPIRIEMYRNRIEIISPGGLYGKITIDSLGKVHPDTRNATLTNILELLGVTENRYSGIPTILGECRNAGLLTPVFEVRRGEFVVTIFNNIYDGKPKKNGETMQEDVLHFCTVAKTRAEIIEFTGLSRFYTMNSIVQPLIEQGLLSMSLPDKPKSSKQTYVKV